MKIDQLVPLPDQVESFRWNRVRYVPENGGCYALTTFEKDVLYLGLATDLQRRMKQHLDSPEKVALTEHGRAIWFYWLECEDLNKVERTWMNIYTLHHGVLPILNKAYSPTAT